MKKWIMMIFKINKQLEQYFDKLENRIHKLSLNSTMPTLKLYDSIIELSYRRNKLINLRVLYNVMTDSLNDSEVDFMLEMCAQARYFKEDASEKRGNVGELNRIVGICKAALIESGYSTKRLENDYKSFFFAKKEVA